MLDRIARNWVYGAGPAALLLLVLAPGLLSAAPLAIWLVYLALPAYMVHQVEEHDADRFRVYINDLLGPTRTGLSPGDVAVINLALVWLPLALVVWLVSGSGAGWAAISGWLLLVNGVAHVGPAVVWRRRNPGLVSALVLFVPLGLALVLGTGATAAQHATGLAVAIALHGAIVARAARPVAKRPPHDP